MLLNLSYLSRTGLDFWLEQEITEVLKWLKEAEKVYSELDKTF